MIKNIIFDLGNVILKDNPSIVLENLELSSDSDDDFDIDDVGEGTTLEDLLK